MYASRSPCSAREQGHEGVGERAWRVPRDRLLLGGEQERASFPRRPMDRGRSGCRSSVRSPNGRTTPLPPFVDLWEGLTELGTTENDVYTPLFLEDVKDTLRDHVNKAIRTFDPWIHTTGMRAFRPV
jgi:hypothetical protein